MPPGQYAAARAQPVQKVWLCRRVWPEPTSGRSPPAAPPVVGSCLPPFRGRHLADTLYARLQGGDTVCAKRLCLFASISAGQLLLARALAEMLRSRLAKPGKAWRRADMLKCFTR